MRKHQQRTVQGFFWQKSGMMMFIFCVFMSGIVKGQGVQVAPSEPVAQLTTEMRQLLYYAPAEVDDKNRAALNRIISVELTDVPMEEALRQIAALGELRLAYSTSVGKEYWQRKVSVQYERATVLGALYAVLEDTDLKLTLSTTSANGQIVVEKDSDEKKEKLLPLPIFQQDITGRVIDTQTGEVLPGVNIILKGTTIGTSTDSEGFYELQVPSLNDTLVVSYIGYHNLEIPINGRGVVDVHLQSQAIVGEDLIVIGYGTARKESLTGSVASIGGSDLENIPSSRVDQILQGRASGLQVTQVSGEPGAGTMIRIRGGNSIEGDNAPLFVIDGYVAGSNYNLNNINTNDIQSIEILKDATAISIYGTRGSNGVILITTKSGGRVDPGVPQVSVNTYFGTQTLMNEIDFLDGSEHAAYANEDAEYRGTALPFSNPNVVPNINWVDQITRVAPISNFDVSVAGQSENRNSQYYISGNYYDQQGIIKSSGIQKYNIRTNLDFTFSDRVKAGVRMNVSRLRNENNKVNLAGIIDNVTPSRDIYNADGMFTATNPITSGVSSNPVADIQLKVDHEYSTNLLGNLYLEVEPIDNLMFRSTFGSEINTSKRNRYNPGALPNNLIVNEGGDGQIDSFSGLDIINENTISYITNFGDDHDLDLLGGFTWQTNRVEGYFSGARGFPNDVLKFNSLNTGGDPARNEVGSSWDSFQLVSWLGRVNYQFRNKYLFTLVGRVDGSSRFASAENQYGFFPSGAVAWRLDQEPFIDDLDIFDLLKVRTSYGFSGSQSIESFRTLPVLQQATTTFNEILQTGVVNGRPANEDLRWETTKQLDIGLEAAFLNGRLSIEADYYRKLTEDLLLNVRIPSQTGFESRLQNLGSIRNYGMEFKVNATIVSNTNFQWNSMFTISGNRNRVLDLGGVDFIDVVGPTNQGGPGGRLIVGQPVPVFIGVEYLGTWKSQDEIDVSGQTGQHVGGPRFKDTNGDGEVNIEDFEILGNPQPDFYGGFQNTLVWRNFELDIFIQGTYGNDIFNSMTQFGFFGLPERNKYAEVIDRWTPENPDSDIPRAGSISENSEVVNNSKMIEDGSHLRLKNLKLTYNIPTQRFNFFDGFKGLSVYFSGTNLLLFSSFRLFDPEVSRYGDDSVAVGFSRGEYPYARTITLGLRANF